MKGGAAPVLEDTQHVTYPNLAQIENGFVQIANYICLALKQAVFPGWCTCSIDWKKVEDIQHTNIYLSLSICPNFQHLFVWALYH